MRQRRKGLQIEYLNEEEDAEEYIETPVTAVEAEIVTDDKPYTQAEEEILDEPIDQQEEYSSDDLEDYVYHERVGTLELINYLPRVPKPVLRGERDFTAQEWKIASEDFARGFRPLETKYSIEYQVPDDASKFRTQADISRDIAKVSPGLVGKWVVATITESENNRKFPPRLLKDDFGFTPYAEAIYRNLMRYTCTRRFIANDHGVIDWDSIDRDSVPPPIKNPELSEENPDYPLSPVYWQKLNEQYLDYCDRIEWLAEYKQARTLKEQEPEVMQFGDGDRELGHKLSQFAARVELAKQAALQHLGKELEDLGRQAIRLATQGGAKARTESLEAYAEAFNQSAPQPLKEEEDLWSGE